MGAKVVSRKRKIPADPVRDATGIRGGLCWGCEEGDDHRDGRGGSACRRGDPLLRTSPDLPLVGAMILPTPSRHDDG